MLIERGMKGGETPETWVLEHPDEVASVHKAFYDAGADIVITNTLGGTSIKLEHFGLSKRAGEINKRGAELVRKVCPEGKFVAGDIGSTGKMLKPYGDATEADLLKAFDEQARALREGGVDLFIIETMIDLSEALVAVDAALPLGLPVFACVTFDKKPRGYFTIMGQTPKDVAKALTDRGASAVGTNCNLRIGDMVGLVGEFAESTGVPIIAQPNAGRPNEVVDGPEVFERWLPDLISAGAWVVGGCCGTTPEAIRRMRGVIDRM
jgi:5-methyltetrahydrofolate--homocysteine methyltransferase